MLVAQQQTPHVNILLTVKDVAEYLSVTERTVYRLVKGHRLPAYRVGGQWRFKAELIEAWIQYDGMTDAAQATAPAPQATLKYA